MREKDAVRPYLTTTQAARLCHLSPSTLLRAVRDKKIKAFSTPGGHFRVERASVEEYARLSGVKDLGGKKSRRVLLFSPQTAESARLVRQLESVLGVKVSSTGSSFDAGALAVEEKPVAVVVDADAPAAPDLIAALSRRGCPILLLGAAAKSPAGTASLRLKKPFTPAEASEALAKLLDK